MINLSRVVTDPVFATNYTVVRTAATWVNGRFTKGEPTQLPFYGSVQPATNQDLEQLPAGDRQSGMMKFFCKPPNTFNITTENQGDDTGFVSDEIIYNGQIYKIVQVKDWSQFGYVRAFAYSVRSVV